MNLLPNLKKARMEIGLTQSELAGRINPPVTAQSVSFWESGRRSPGLDILIQLSEILMKPIDYLVDRQNSVA